MNAEEDIAKASPFAWSEDHSAEAGGSNIWLTASPPAFSECCNSRAAPVLIRKAECRPQTWRLDAGKSVGLIRTTDANGLAWDYGYCVQRRRTSQESNAGTLSPWLSPFFKSELWQ